MKKDKSKIPNTKFYTPKPGYNKLTGRVIDEIPLRERPTKENSKRLPTKNTVL